MADVRLLICFDGSRPAPFGGLSWGGQLIVPPEFQREVEESLDKEARILADEGASQARAAGLDADTEVRKTKVAVWRELLAAADGVDADVIVAGHAGTAR
jgi:hypothetical protein